MGRTGNGWTEKKKLNKMENVPEAKMETAGGGGEGREGGSAFLMFYLQPVFISQVAFVGRRVNRCLLRHYENDTRQWSISLGAC